jgi:hypothetical protein
MAAAMSVIHEPKQLAVGPDAVDVDQADVPPDPRHGQLAHGVIGIVREAVAPCQKVVVGPEHADRFAVEPTVQLREWGPWSLDNPAFMPADRVGVDAQLAVAVLAGELL